MAERSSGMELKSHPPGWPGCPVDPSSRWLHFAGVAFFQGTLRLYVLVDYVIRKESSTAG